MDKGREGLPGKGNCMRKKYRLISGMAENLCLGSDGANFSTAELNLLLHCSHYNYFSLFAFLGFPLFFFFKVMSSCYFILRKKKKKNLNDKGEKFRICSWG